MSAARALPPGYRTLDDIVQEHGRDQVQAKLLSGQWPAFKLDLKTGDLEPIPVTTWCVARGRTWLEGGLLPGGVTADTLCVTADGAVRVRYAVIVQVKASERPPRRKRKKPQRDRFDPHLAKHYPGGTDGIPTKVVYKKIEKDLEADSKKQGLVIPSETSLKRKLGRRE